MMSRDCGKCFLVCGDNMYLFRPYTCSICTFEKKNTKIKFASF